MTEEKKEDLNISPLEKAEKMVERMEAANKEASRILEEQQKLAARNLLGGRSDAGVQDVPKVETPREYKDRIMRGG